MLLLRLLLLLLMAMQAAVAAVLTLRECRSTSQDLTPPYVAA